MPKHLRAAVPQLQPPEFFWHSLGTVLIYRQTSPCDLTKPGCSVSHLIDDGGKTQTQKAVLSRRWPDRRAPENPAEC